MTPTGWADGESESGSGKCGKSIKDNFIHTGEIPTNFWCNGAITFDTSIVVLASQVQWVLW